MCVPHKNIHEAKLAVMAEVPYLRKRKGKDLPYTFAGEADLLAKVQPSFVKHGIDCAPIDAAMMFNGEYQTGKGHRMAHMGFILTYEFTHAESSTKQIVKVISEAADSSDKCCGKAMTGALKYAIRQFLLIETGDDPDKMKVERGTESDVQALAEAAELSKKLYEERITWIEKPTVTAEWLADLRPKLVKDPRLSDPDRSSLLKKLDARIQSLREPGEPASPDPDISATVRGEHTTSINNCESKETLLTIVRESIARDKRLIDSDRAALTDLLLRRGTVLDTQVKKSGTDWGEWQNRQEKKFRAISSEASRLKALDALIKHGAPDEVTTYLVEVLGEVKHSISGHAEPVNA